MLTVEWLENQHYSRAELLEISKGALLGALQPILGPDLATAETAGPQ
ncbi:hypothetical protein [Nocardia brasiliensis]|nr:hypothetical protein [Nocardia brasiliensis]